MRCNRNSIGAWERLRIKNLGPGKIALRGGRPGQYCADDNDRVICNMDYASPGAWEMFTVESLGGNRIALRGGQSGKYCADDHGDRMVCNRDAIWSLGAVHCGEPLRHHHPPAVACLPLIRRNPSLRLISSTLAWCGLQCFQRMWHCAA